MNAFPKRERKWLDGASVRTSRSNGPPPAPSPQAPEALSSVQEKVSVGVAGWSYPDWAGYVYPSTEHDKLAWVARFVDVIEINSTFYRPPDARTTASWVRRTRTRERFFFTAKLAQEITHAGRMEPGTIRAIREGFQPLVEAGRLRHLLAQFRYDVADTPAVREHLQRIRDTFGDLANLTLEMRHRSWQTPEALDYLRHLNVTLAVLDYPRAKNSFDLDVSGVGPHAYFRLHGRNVQAWFSASAGRNETYNYLYSSQELDQIAARTIRIATLSRTVTLIANNHYQGKEMVAALEVTARLRGEKVPVPPLLLERYPHLRKIASNAPENFPLPPTSEDGG